jgi:large subunit ribosomal protein L30
MALVKITQERSKIRCLDKHKRTLAALGLRRIRHSVVKNDTPQIRGMIASISYLLRVEPATAGDAKPARPAASAAKAKAAGAAKSAKPAKSAAPRAPRDRATKDSATAAKGGSK